MCEFDSYAVDYDELAGNPIKRMLRVSSKSFLKRRLEILNDRILELRNVRETPIILDFGCGTGQQIAELAVMFPDVTWIGFDPSAAMIERAVEEYGDSAVFLSDEGELEKTYGVFDMVILSSVLHHVEPEERQELLEGLLNRLRVGGSLIVIEHNPRNVLTALAVRMTPVDRLAKLLTPRLLTKLKQVELETHYFLFLPPEWPFSRAFDSCFRRLPLGGQWFSVMEKLE